MDSIDPAPETKPVEKASSPPPQAITTPKGTFRKYYHEDGKVEVEFSPTAVTKTCDNEERADEIITNTIETFKREGAVVSYKGLVYAETVKVINSKFDPEYVHKPNTKEGKRLFLVPPKGYKVVLNPDYDPQTDATYYATSFSKDGTKRIRHYTQDFVKKSKSGKFEFVKELDKRLPRIRSRYKRDLNSPEPGTRAHALAALLFDYLLFRAGNPKSEKRGIRGLTTLQCRHVKVAGSSIDFNYTGKDSTKQHQYLRDCPKTAKLVAVMLRGKDPTDYFLSWKNKDGSGGRVTPDSANAYLSGLWKPLTTHKFRSYHATNDAREKLDEPVPRKYKESDKKLLKWMKLQLKSVTRDLGHKSISTTINHYIAPEVMHDFFNKHDFKLPKTVFASAADDEAYHRFIDHRRGCEKCGKVRSYDRHKFGGCGVGNFLAEEWAKRGDERRRLEMGLED